MGNPVVGGRTSAPFRWERSCQKLTVLSRGANRSATLTETFLRGGRCGARCSVGGRLSWKDSVLPAGCRRRPRCADGGAGRRFRAGRSGLTQRNRVSTLEQSPGSGDTAANPNGFTRDHAERAGYAARPQNLPRAARAARWVAVVAKRNEEIQPWPRASGHSSRTIGVAHGCMDSACGCGRVQGARS